MSASPPADDARALLDLLAEIGRMRTLRDPIARLTGIEEELSPAQLHTLMWLGRDAPLPMATLAQRLGVSGPTATGVVDRLEKAGFAARGSHADDRRVVLVALTDEGRTIATRLEEVAVGRLASVLGLLDDEARGHLLRSIDSLVQAVRRSLAEPLSPPDPEVTS